MASARRSNRAKKNNSNDIEDSRTLTNSDSLGEQVIVAHCINREDSSSLKEARKRNEDDSDSVSGNQLCNVIIAKERTNDSSSLSSQSSRSSRSSRKGAGGVDDVSLHTHTGGLLFHDYLERSIQNLEQEFSNIIRDGPLKPEAYKVFTKNPTKNRYLDIPCLDRTRVMLKDAESDYIHANYVDGYRQKNAYILCQGPLDTTLLDFWHMIWQESCNVIVMVTKVREGGLEKCHKYWPDIVGASIELEAYSVVCKKVAEDKSFIKTTLLLTNLSTNESRTVAHALFSAWPDFGVPLSSREFLEFLKVVRLAQIILTQNMTGWTGHKNGPPVVVHCSAGIGRSGTYVAVDICCRKLKETKHINIQETVQKIRTQRALSVQRKEQYVFIVVTVLQYAVDEKIDGNSSKAESICETIRHEMNSQISDPIAPHDG